MYLSFHAPDGQDYEPFRSALKAAGFFDLKSQLYKPGTTVYFLEPQNEVMIKHDCVGSGSWPDWNFSMMPDASQEAVRIALEYLEPTKIEGPKGPVDKGVLMQILGLEPKT